MHLAMTAASYDEGPVVLVDCNLVQPCNSKALSEASCPGLVECLHSGDSPLELIQSSPLENLSILPAGELRGSPARFFNSAKLPKLVECLAERLRLTVFDMPPAGQASCSNRLAGLLNGVLLVIEAERVSWEVAQRVKELLVRAESHLLGAVLNKRRDSAPQWILDT
jgi:Mrp family chromosome partitioning ATPase